MIDTFDHAIDVLQMMPCTATVVADNALHGDGCDSPHGVPAGNPTNPLQMTPCTATIVVLPRVILQMTPCTATVLRLDRDGQVGGGVLVLPENDLDTAELLTEPADARHQLLLVM